MVVTGEAAIFPGRLPLRSPTTDLLRRGAAPSSLLGLWEADVFFLHLPRFRWCAQTESASSLSRSAASSSPLLLLLLRFAVALSSDDHPKVQSTPKS